MTHPARTATHHDRILRELRANILSGTWKPGFQLQFETDMAASYGVSRMTINKVLTQLTREGFLDRRRKLGTSVAMPRVQSAVMAISDIEQEIGDLGLGYGYRLLNRSRRPPAGAVTVTQGLGTTAVDPLWVAALHFGGDTPFCLEERLINLDAAPAAADQDFAAISPGKWLLRQVPWSAAEHGIRAVNATAASAKHLAIRPGEACLEVTRRTRRDETWVTWARLTYPGQRHQLVAQFTPGQKPV